MPSCGAKRVIAWVFLVGGLLGFALSLFQVIGKDEPLLVLLLSWAALVYEGFNAVAIQDDKKD
jgi:hypothetical protein